LAYYTEGSPLINVHSERLQEIYKSLVCPQLEYAAPVLDTDDIIWAIK